MVSGRRVEKKVQAGTNLQTETQKEGIDESVDHLDTTAHNVL